MGPSAEVTSTYIGQEQCLQAMRGCRDSVGKVNSVIQYFESYLTLHILLYSAKIKMEDYF